MRIVLASGNRGKLRELEDLLLPLGHDVIAQAEFGIDSPPETGSTFVENAMLKARHAAQISGLPALADDSGIEVDALDGRPGIHSARYAGEAATDIENVRKLLVELTGVAADLRTARYQCAIVLVRSADDADPIITYGTWEGRILTMPRGTGGFGYDPVFVPIGSDQSAAELDPAKKNEMSHRGQALEALIDRLAQEEVPPGTNGAEGSP
jgi:XTP/dITP diphosphohydrolase